MLKKLCINDIILTLEDNVHCKIEDSHLWKVLEGNDDEHNYYYRDNSNRRHLLQEFKDLSIDFEYLSGKFSNSYIIVKKCGNKYYTIDGDHRLTILKFNGVKEVLCLIK